MVIIVFEKEISLKRSQRKVKNYSKKFRKMWNNII